MIGKQPIEFRVSDVEYSVSKSKRKKTKSGDKIRDMYIPESKVKELGRGKIAGITLLY